MIETLNGAIDMDRPADLNGSPAWLKKIRHSAAARAIEIGFPTTRDEEWRFTSVEPALQEPWHVRETAGRRPSERDIAPWALGLEGCRLVFVDGYICEELCLVPARTQDLYVGSLEAALA